MTKTAGMRASSRDASLQESGTHPPPPFPEVAMPAKGHIDRSGFQQQGTNSSESQGSHLHPSVVLGFLQTRGRGACGNFDLYFQFRDLYSKKYFGFFKSRVFVPPSPASAGSPVSRVISAYFMCKAVPSEMLCGTAALNASETDIYSFAEHWGNYGLRQ